MKKILVYMIIFSMMMCSYSYALTNIKVVGTDGQIHALQIDSDGKLVTTSDTSIVNYTQGVLTITNVAAIITAADSTGRNVFIQNNDAVGIVYLSLTGTATATDDMIKLSPGDNINLINISNSISAIGSIASNANVAILEGD